MSQLDSPPAGPRNKMSSKSSVNQEYCQGYMDKDGIWNNGFYCRRWGGQDLTYCCGDGRARFCCPESHNQVTTTNDYTLLPQNTFKDHIPLIIGIGISVVVIIIVVMITSCYFCPCCPVKKRQRNNRKQSSSVVRNGTIPINAEAEMTSSGIAAEALQLPVKGAYAPLRQSPYCYAGHGPASPHHNPFRTQQDNHHPLRLERQWSLETSQCTVEDIDSVINSIYHHDDANLSPWQPELGLPCSCNFKPNLFGSESKPSPSGSNSSYNQSGGGSPVPQCMETFRLKRLVHPDDLDGPLYPKQRAMDAGRPLRLGPFRGNLAQSSSVAPHQERNTPGWRDVPRVHPAAADADRLKRDSGVLVEDNSDNGSSHVSLGGLNGGGADDHRCTSTTRTIMTNCI